MSDASTTIQPVLLAGGEGTRLWPLSRRAYPKQFVSLLNDENLLAATFRRLQNIDHRSPLVVCNEAHRFLAAEVMRNIGTDPVQLLLEPVARDTGPAIALAALEAAAGDEDPTLLVLPADHDIPETEAFSNAVEVAVAAANDGALVTFGVEPDHAATGYGYIRARGGGRVRAVEAFVEKPDRASAERYMAEDGYYWNSGMFVFRASAYIEALVRYAPEMLAAVRAAYAGRSTDNGFVRYDAEAFSAAPRASIDYAVMEYTDRAWTVPLDGAWRDIGSWRSLWEAGIAHGEGDDSDTVTRGDVVARDVRGCYLHATGRLIAAVGLSDCVIVETADAVLVAPRDSSEDVKQMVAELDRDGRAEVDLHRRVSCPWGSYQGIDRGERFQVKRIEVRPGGSLSLQMHHHRAEHWIVVRGTARVTAGDRSFLLMENESTFIPIGTTHRLENPGHIPLELIEVQSGSYLEEDDIVRFDDEYGRSPGGAM